MALLVVVSGFEIKLSLAVLPYSCRAYAQGIVEWSFRGTWKDGQFRLRNSKKMLRLAMVFFLSAQAVNFSCPCRRAWKGGQA